jgi:N-acetylmuramoyl-L-alanine amidase
MKFCIDPGHNCPPKDTGAVGYLNEEKVAAEVSKLLKDELIKRGHQAILTNATDGTSVSNSVHQRVRQSDDYKPDLFVSIHCNASVMTELPMGSEVFIGSSKTTAVATKVCSALQGLGFKNRGVKEGNHLFVLKYTEAPAILIEMFFCDSRYDITRYEQLGAAKMANAIAEALTNAK